MTDPETSKPSSRESQPSALRWVLLAIVLVAGFWFGLRALQDAEPEQSGGPLGAGMTGPPPATVIAAVVAQKPIQERRRVTGTLRAAQRADVASQETGAVRAVRIDVGDVVEVGAVLVELDDRRLVASLAEARATVTAAVAFVAERAAEAERAQTDLDRKDELFAQRAVSEREFLDAKREASVSKFRLEAAFEEKTAAEKSLELLEVRVDDLHVKAPFAGRVVERYVDPGEWLSPGSPVVTLISSGTIEAWVQVPERFIAEVSSESKSLEIVVDGNDMRVPATAVRRVADINPVTRLFSVVVELDDQNGALVPGLSVFAELAMGAEEELSAVPVDAVIETFQGASVFRVAAPPEEGMPIAERVSVEVEFRENGFVYLKPGALKPGEQVVVEGNERLFPGTPLILGELPDENPAETINEVKP